MTLRRMIAELICTAEENGLMDLQVSNIYFPSHADIDESENIINTVMVEVSDKSDAKYGIKPIHRKEHYDN